VEHDETPLPDPSLSELTRPRRQFKEDGRKQKKKTGRKLKKMKRDAKYTNWFHPLLWSQIQAAALRVRKPWKPRAILKELHKANAKDFYKLTEQVIGRWMARDANNKTMSKWKETVLENVASRGNAPGGQNTRSGVLVSSF
jgi:tRNA uridine 5-carbamoylmethylation protein Kti12